jgi:hypothetical protein
MCSDCSCDVDCGQMVNMAKRKYPFSLRQLAAAAELTPKRVNEILSQYASEIPASGDIDTWVTLIKSHVRHPKHTRARMNPHISDKQRDALADVPPVAGDTAIFNALLDPNDLDNLSDADLDSNDRFSSAAELEAKVRRLRAANRLVRVRAEILTDKTTTPDAARSLLSLIKAMVTKQLDACTQKAAKLCAHKSPAFIQDTLDDLQRDAFNTIADRLSEQVTAEDARAGDSDTESGTGFGASDLRRERIVRLRLQTALDEANLRIARRELIPNSEISAVLAAMGKTLWAEAQEVCGTLAESLAGRGSAEIQAALKASYNKLLDTLQFPDSLFTPRAAQP